MRGDEHISGCFPSLFGRRKTSDRNDCSTQTSNATVLRRGAGAIESKTSETSPNATVPLMVKQHLAAEPCCYDYTQGLPTPREDLPAYTSSEKPWNSDAWNTAHSEIIKHTSELKDISLYISDHPELGYEETRAHARVTKYLKEQGFEVEEHYILPTAFKATFTHGKGERVFGINGEFDALPEVGHACGHNLICVAGVAALLGMRAAMKKHNIEGKVVLLGTPAEEGGEGKIKLLKAGAYKEMDVCMMCHPDAQTPGQHSVLPSLAIQSIWIEYYGRTAQASAQPWEGINALDACYVAWGSISAMRQQLTLSDRVHGIITNGGAAANIIPDYASMKYYVRATNAEALEKLKAKILPCFEAAAKATGCKVKITMDDVTLDQRNVEPLADEYANIVKDLFGTKTVVAVKDSGFGYGGKASTDFGNVTYALPSCHANYGIPTKRANHTPEFQQAARTEEAHEETWRAATGVACTGLRVLKDGEFTNKATQWWKDDMKTKMI